MAYIHHLDNMSNVSSEYLNFFLLKFKTAHLIKKLPRKFLNPKRGYNYIKIQDKVMHLGKIIFKKL